MDDAVALIEEIEAFCRSAGIAESTFGRRAVNDGKFVGRLRDGKRVTSATIHRIRTYMSEQAPSGTAGSPAVVARGADDIVTGPAMGNGNGSVRAAAGAAAPADTSAMAPSDDEGSSFRFYDNRQKYLMFVNTCSEKWAVAERVGQELAQLQLRPPALRVFDAGVGDGTVLTRTMRNMHRRFPTVPFYIVGKEISLEDVRLTLEKMPDRFYEHPATVLVITNLYYAEAPKLMPRSVQSAAMLNWQEVPLSGNSAHAFDEQITALQPMLSEGWQVRASAKTGNPLYVRPSVLVLYREDHKFLLDQIIPRPGNNLGEYDLVIASQPYRARMDVEFKVQKVLAPLARSLAPGGRMLTIHSHGRDPGIEIIRNVWPGENPFIHDRHTILKHLKAELGRHNRDLNFKANSDKRALFQYSMHTLPSEIGPSIGTSTLLAAWNAAIYVAQIEDERLEDAFVQGKFLDATRDVLQEYGGLWFNDESFVVSRRRA